MIDDDVSARRALLERVAHAAAAQTLDLWRRRAELLVETKGDPRDIVSRADRETEVAIRAAVGEAFPDDGFLGEELGHQPGRSGYLWVIDPIDGTTPFLFGHPTWCVSIAVARGTEPVAAAIAVPAVGEMLLAQKGGGAELNGVPLRIDPALTLRSAMTAIGASHRTDPDAIGEIVSSLIRAGGMYYRNGSGALMLAYVAAGRLAGYFEPHMHAWDCLAGLLLVQEAGGVVGPYPSGNLASGGRVIASSPGAWDDLMALTRGA